MLATVIVSGCIVALAIIIHYEMLRQISLLIPRMSIKSRFRVLYALSGALIAHIVEVQLFAVGYYLMIHSPVSALVDFGSLAQLDGSQISHWLDCTYYSFSTYTSLGLGDIFPVGHMRFLTGLEALTGLVLITWTASFMFIEMEKFWRVK